MIRGKFLAINAASMSCACPRSPKGLSPAAHLADGTTDLILVRKCSRFNFLRHLLRHTSKDDQVYFQSKLKQKQKNMFLLIFFRHFGPQLNTYFSVRSISLTLPSLRSIEWGVFVSCHVTAKATRTWSWTCMRIASGRSSARSAKTTQLVAVHPPTAAGTAMARSWPTQPLMSGMMTLWDLLPYKYQNLV